MAKYCSKCKEKIKGNPKFCPECGHKFPKFQEKSKQKSKPVKKSIKKEPIKSVKKKKIRPLNKGKIKWITGVIALVIILSTIIVYGYYHVGLPNLFAEPIIDSDGDGYNDAADAFPNDPCASADSDDDGYPDDWNTGKDQSDSTSNPPLVLDAFPYDPSKWKPIEEPPDEPSESEDTDGDDLSDDYELQIGTDPFDPDSDKDGLMDGSEVNDYGTDPNDTNTDGDRYSDYMECTGVDMPSYVKGKGASPLYPAVPVLQIIPSTSFDIVLAKEITTSVGNITTKTRTIESGYQETTNTITGGYLEVGVGGGNIVTSLLGGGLPFSIKAGVYHTNQHTTNIYSNNIYTIANQEQWYRAEHIELPDSFIRVQISIKNIGTDILQSEIDDIIVNLFIGNDTEPSLDTWNLNRDEYRIRNLEPGKSSVEITAKFYGFTTDELRRIDMGESIRVVISHYSFGQDELILWNATNRMIKVTIDDGTSVVYDYVRPEEANTFVDIISSITDIIVENGEIERVGSFSKTANSGWIALVPTNEDIDTDSELLNTVFTAGDEIVLIYLRDSDGDNILDREERLLGLNSSSQDSDGDTLNDYDELYGKYETSPVLADSDFDGLQDDFEINSCTYPLDEDTDGDGISDGEEVTTYGTNPCYNDTDYDGILDGRELYWLNLGFGNFDPLTPNSPTLTLNATDDTYIYQQTWSRGTNYGHVDYIYRGF